MKQQHFIKQILLGTALIAGHSKIISKETIFFEFPLKTAGILGSEFLQQVRQLGGGNIFVETGTCGGDTTAQAALVFDEVHSIELGSNLFQQSYNFLCTVKNRERIYLYLGDSGKVLNNILPKITGKIVFWLDAHDSGGVTARGDCYSPVIQELEAIKLHNKNDSIIIIDDLRDFYTTEWPTLSQAVTSILNINPNYQIITQGDCIIAYPNNINVKLSSCLESCSLSRLFDTHCFDYDVNDVLKAEERIAQTKGLELESLHKLFPFIQTSSDPYGILWQALIFEQMGENKKAYALLEELSTSQHPRKINHWRISWYLARVAFKNGRLELAKKNIQKVLNEKPNFEPAQNLFNSL